MSSNSIMQNFQRSQALPVSQTPLPLPLPALRRRLPSLSSISSPSPLSSWSFPRSKSFSSMGDYAGSSVKIWWVWGWSWLLSKKPIFAQDLEMNEEEAIILGSNNKGSWRHVFYKLRYQINKLMGSHNVCLPQTYPKKKKIYG